MLVVATVGDSVKFWETEACDSVKEVLTDAPVPVNEAFVYEDDSVRDDDATEDTGFEIEVPVKDVLWETALPDVVELEGSIGIVAPVPDSGGLVDTLGAGLVLGLLCTEVVTFDPVVGEETDIGGTIEEVMETEVVPDRGRVVVRLKTDVKL